jgi:hypothetical protein
LAKFHPMKRLGKIAFGEMRSMGVLGRLPAGHQRALMDERFTGVEPIELQRLPIAVLTSRGTIRTQEARPMVGQLSTRKPGRMVRRRPRHLLNPLPERRLQAHCRRQALHAAPGSDVVACRPKSNLHRVRCTRGCERAELA